MFIDNNFKEIYRAKRSELGPKESLKAKRDTDDMIRKDPTYKFHYKLMKSNLEYERDNELAKLPKNRKSEGLEKNIRDLYESKLSEKNKELIEDMYNYKKYQKMRYEWLDTEEGTYFYGEIEL